MRRRVLAVLCLTEIVSWGTLYYAFPVLAPSIAGDTGWSLGAVTAAFSGGLVVSALAGIPAGRLLDRHGPRRLMTGASVLGGPALAAVALTGSFGAFVAAWLVVGFVQAGTLYPPAFAALTRWWGEDRVRALTTLTLVAGLASTVFAPLTAALLGGLGWRGTYLVLAVVLAVVTVPAHLLGLRGEWPAATGGTRVDEAGAAAIVRSRPFLLLTAAVCLGAFTSFAVTVNQVPLLLERGLSTTLAAWALGLGGLGQVLGRLGYPRLAARTGSRGRAALILGLLAATSVLLAVLPGPAALLVAAAVLAGGARGVFTLLQATALSDRWSPEVYGRLNGVLQAPATIAIALGPAAGSGLAVAFGGYPEVFVLLAAVALVAAACTAGTRPVPARAREG